MNSAVVALILVVCIRLGSTAIFDPVTAAIAVVSLLSLLVWNINSTWLILFAGLAGWVTRKLHSH